MLKKLIVIGIVIAMIIITLIGYFGSVDSTSSSIDTTKSEEKKELVPIRWVTIGSEPKDKQMIVDAVNEYIGDKIGVKLDMQFVDFGDYAQKTSLMINTGDNFDIMFASAWSGTYIENARKGAFLDVEPYLKTVGKDMHSAIDDRFWEGSKVNGKMYAVPNQKELFSMKFLTFTKQYVDKYDIPYKEIKAMEDLEPYLKTIVENEQDIVPFYIAKGFSPPLFFDIIQKPIGVDLSNSEFVVENIYETDRMKEQFETLRRYYEKGYINKDGATALYKDETRVFANRKDGQPYADNIWSEVYGEPVVSTQIMDGVITSGSTLGSLLAISSNTKNPEKSVEFINLLNTDVYLRNLLSYGIEGIHYEKVSENQIKLDPIKSKDYQPQSYTLGNLFITYVLDKDPADKWEKFKEFNDTAISSKILGFSFDASSVANEITAINNVISEFEPILSSGSVDPDKYIKKFNDKLYAQGLQKVIDEAQAQLDAWLEQK